jgi:hypothetical protein
MWYLLIIVTPFVRGYADWVVAMIDWIMIHSGLRWKLENQKIGVSGFQC